MTFFLNFISPFFIQSSVKELGNTGLDLITRILESLSSFDYKPEDLTAGGLKFRVYYYVLFINKSNKDIKFESPDFLHGKDLFNISKAEICLKPNEIKHCLFNGTNTLGSYGIRSVQAVTVNDSTGYFYLSLPTMGCNKMCYDLDRKKLIKNASDGEPFEVELEGVKIVSKGLTNVDQEWVGCCIEFE